MATATALVSNARTLNVELTRCTRKLEEVRSSILGRAEPEDVRRKFRGFRDATLCLGRSLLLDGRFKSRLPTAIRNQALDMLRNGAKPITIRQKLGLTGVTVQNLRRRDLGDHRNLRRACKLTPAQVAEIRAGYGTPRQVFAEKFGVSIDVVSRARHGRGSYREVTKVSPVQSTLAKRENVGRPADGELKLKFSRPLIESLMEMAELAGEDVQPYVISLIESQIADWRARHLPADFLKLRVSAKDREAVEKTSRHSLSSLTEEEEDKMLQQFRDEEMTAPALSRRWGRGESTIRRALERAKKRASGTHPTSVQCSPEVIQKIIFLGTKKYDGDEHIGVPEIAQRCDVPESVVAHVLQGHKPLVQSSSTVYGHRAKAGGWGRHVEAI